jgi:hypothetical protein
MLHNIEQKGGVPLPQKEYKEADKKKFGKAIKKAREALPKGSNSQRYIAEQIGIPNSTLKSFEDGVSVPTFKVYKALIDVLNPNEKQKQQIEKHYCELKGTPPPDVCETMVKIPNLNDLIRIINDKELSNNQVLDLIDMINGGK